MSGIFDNTIYTPGPRNGQLDYLFKLIESKAPIEHTHLIKDIVDFNSHNHDTLYYRRDKDELKMWYSGNGNPDNQVGKEGDFYVDLVNGGIYKKVQGYWVLQFSTIGPSGLPGEDGVSPIITVDTIDNGYKVTLTDRAGKKEIDLTNGADGATYIPTLDAEGNLSWTNNSDLPNPEPVNIKGNPGVNGKTPEKGVDYFTEEDKQEFVEAVLEALPNGNEVLY